MQPMNANLNTLLSLDLSMSAGVFHATNLCQLHFLAHQMIQSCHVSQMQNEEAEPHQCSAYYCFQILVLVCDASKQLKHLIYMDRLMSHLNWLKAPFFTQVGRFSAHTTRHTIQQ